MILTLITFFLSSIGRWVAGGLIIALLFGGFVLKIRRDAVRAERAAVEEMNREAISKANEARDAVRTKCDRVPNDCLHPDNFRD